MDRLRKDECSDLLTRLRAKQESAHVEFVQRWVPRFERDLRNHGFPPADAYDLAFSCATEVLSKIALYKRGEDGLDAWVLTVGRNFAKDWRRKNRKMKLVPLSPTLPACDPMDADPKIPSPRIAAALAALEGAMAQFSAEDRKLIELRYGSSPAAFPAIARELSIKGNAARTRHHRMLFKLKTLLEQDSRIKKLL